MYNGTPYGVILTPWNLKSYDLFLKASTMKLGLLIILISVNMVKH
jgi:hypothetical protein